ncbi:serine/threonine-protein kinase [Nocardia bovistercoris]|uniref:non-specific serine/threonine protein kinase n=1 Tax=Nocardia bovistercoris TaxID=2785916 RepID=A0A931N4E8_9NOCA|nr:serine/threonine-protein kinase [Nocardia bovistercoris]MBH0777548.1 serine/threonine protein kinase [Nocardia bovistercoris]
MALRPGAIVGGYRVLEVLGSGGMGTVYLAQNPILPRRDALKVLSADLSTDPEFRARFEREANLAAALDHPNLVAVYNRGEEDGQLWIAMQYVDGTDAAEEAAKGPSAMTPQRALRIVAEIGKGLDYAHRRGLLHRDVKPANFLLSAADEDDEERVLLTDFGVAKSAEDGRDLTATGNFMATVAYAPPEQLMGERLDPRADIYSLGCAFFKLLTGRNPYPATVPAVVMMGHLHEPPPVLSQARPGLPPALDAVIEKVMAKDPARRYATCREFVQAAEAALYGAPQQFHAPYPTDPRPRTHITDPRTAAAHAGATSGMPSAYHAAGGAPGYAASPRADHGIYIEPTDQHLVDTLRNSNGSARARKRRILGIGALLAVAAVVVAAGTYFFATRDSGSGSGDALAAVRNSHPEFSGKTVTAMNYSDGTLSAVLTPSAQAEFLQQIGFRYSAKYKAVGDEKSPRSLSVKPSSNEIDSEVLIVLRTDKDAGNGGFRGLPVGISISSARIVVVDDRATVQAFQVWTDQSTGTLIDKMVPVIAKAVGK